MKPKKGTLFVSDGVVKPDSISPEAVRKFRQRKKRILQPELYVDGIRNYDRTILSQAITLIESSLPAHRDVAAQIIEDCMPLSGNSIRIGITGVPGVGKSTFIESLGKNRSKQQAFWWQHHG
jgi:LAO/AO transport system kinase